jgi:catechol 2,3-dioxygenase-like lactoylglutathione lyase family enzyme
MAQPEAARESSIAHADVRGKEAAKSTSRGAGVAKVDMKVEVIVIPVSDVDRAKEFYGRLGWRLDADFAIGDNFRVIQFTPSGSGCSVHFGKNVTAAAPGSGMGYLIVSDIAAARDELVAAGFEVGEIFHIGTAGRESGLDPERGTYRSRAELRDPDGNLWLLQEITTRFPGRVDAAATSFGSASDLESALRRAAIAHGKHETRIGGADANWPEWYAKYMVAEQAGTELPT